MLVGPGNLSGLVSVLAHRIPALTHWRTLTMTSTIHVSDAVPPPWHAAYPAPKTEAPSITRDAVLKMLRNGHNAAGKDFVLVDLRRADHEVCMVMSSSKYIPKENHLMTGLQIGGDNSRVHQLARSEPVAHHFNPL